MQKVLYNHNVSTFTQGSLNSKSKPAQPVYGKGEELFNAVSHIVGGGLGILFALFAFFKTAQNPTLNKYLAVAVYSFCIIALYTMSALYHFLAQGRAKKVFRIFDHCTIFLLIAGCYTPFCLISFWSQPVGKIIFAVEWGLAIIGITFNAINMNWKAVKVLSQICYVVMGWMVVFILNQFLSVVPTPCFVWLLLGGIFYTVGIVFYALGKKKKYMHCVWHIFVLFGSIFQFVSITYLL